MNTIRLFNNREIGDNCKPYFIAEMNSSHNGKFDKAIEMVRAAKICGCDCVKFQSWTEDSLYSDEYYKSNPIAKRIVKGFSLSEDKLLDIFQFCKEMEIDFSSTPYSYSEVDFLATINVPFIKIASMDINNIPFIKYIAETKIPIILSTGMATYSEIEKAVNTILDTGNSNLCVLHCVSVYPVEAVNVNMRNMIRLKEMFPKCVVGYSDHTLGHSVACGAIALGASVIEKHFTLDNSSMGMDNNMATEPVEMKKLVDSCISVFNSLGDYQRVISDEEQSQLLKMRRSIIAKKDIQKNSVITKDDIECKRPANGIEPCFFDKILGKTINCDVKKGYALQFDFFDRI